MLNQKFFLLSICILTFGVAKANATGGILRNADGSIQCFNQFDASGSNIQGNKVKPDACELAGKGHLATIREIAEESQTMGAAGILEVTQVNPSSPASGYSKISAINPNGHLDEFYFSYTGYVRPNGDLGNNWFWSSSSDSSDAGYALDINGGNGSITSDGRDLGGDGINGCGAVQCFPNN